MNNYFLRLNKTLIILTSAFLDSLNPCAISVLLITIAFLFSLKKERKKIFILGSLYIASIFITYFLIGLGILRAFNILNIPHFIAKFTAFILLLYGSLELLQGLFKNLPINLGIPSIVKEKIGKLIYRASFPSIILSGVLVGLTEFPCTGGPYLFVLGLLNNQATYLQGLVYLFFYNVIFILPLIFILLVVSNEKILTSVGNFKKNNLFKFRIISGLIFIILALIAFFLYF